MKNIKIKNPQKLVEGSNKLRDNTFDLLEIMEDTAETRNLKERLQKCADTVELLDITTDVLKLINKSRITYPCIKRDTLMD